MIVVHWIPTNEGWRLHTHQATCWCEPALESRSTRTTIWRHQCPCALDKTIDHSYTGCSFSLERDELFA